MMVKPERLSALLEPPGFHLIEVDKWDQKIAFCRSAIVPDLFEHLIIHGQGKRGDAVYATSAISALPHCYDDPCIVIEDQSLLQTLSTDPVRGWTVVLDAKQAKVWEVKLAAIANEHCRALGETKGPDLIAKLRPTRLALDQYVAKLGDLNAVFDSEFQFFSTEPLDRQKEADRLAFEFGKTCDDVRLACLVLDKFAADLEGRPGAFRGRRVDEDEELRARVRLLSNYIREKREVYQANEDTV